MKDTYQTMVAYHPESRSFCYPNAWVSIQADILSIGINIKWCAPFSVNLYFLALIKHFSVNPYPANCIKIIVIRHLQTIIWLYREALTARAFCILGLKSGIKKLKAKIDLQYMTNMHRGGVQISKTVV